jgi:glucosyl-3-phosphoglycerate phosphatase
VEGLPDDRIHAQRHVVVTGDRLAGRRRVLVLRHGRTAWNAQHRFQGQADPPLDETGKAQAFEVAPLVGALRPDLLVSSDAKRAMQTAAPLGEITRLTVVPEPRFRERSLGHWEGLTRDEVAQRYPDEFADWVAGRDVSRRGGETREQVAERACSAFAEIPDDTALAVIITHSATAMALCAALLGLPTRDPVLAPLANCHWSELRHGSRWELRAHNVGAPGPVIPRLDLEEDAPDAEA